MSRRSGKRDESLLTLNAAAKELGVDPVLLHTLKASGKLEVVYVARDGSERAPRIHVDEVNRLREQMALMVQRRHRERA